MLTTAKGGVAYATVSLTSSEHLPFPYSQSGHNALTNHSGLAHMSHLYKQYEEAPGGTRVNAMAIAMGQYKARHDAVAGGVVPNISKGETNLSIYDQVQALTNTGKVWREACRFGNPEGFIKFLLVCTTNSYRWRMR